MLEADVWTEVVGRGLNVAVLAAVEAQALGGLVVLLRAAGLDAGAGYTACMTHRMGAKGQVVIPKPLRDVLGLRPGDEVEFTLERRGVRVAPARPRRDLRGAFAGAGLVAALEGEHAAEIAREHGA